MKQLVETPRDSRKVTASSLELKDQTLHVRLAGVDAPEGAHFGMPAQPFSAEAKDWLTNLSMNKKVHLELYSRDRYDRVVSS
jgi:endonuclease YncB( thermonuclease family)